MVGETVGSYRITAKLGQGGMGVVYKADDLKLNRPVALKFLRPDSLSSDSRRRFLREAQAAAQIHHPNICPVYDIGEANGQLYFVMAYLEGSTLAQMIGGAPLNIGLAVDLAVQVLRGLEQAHKSGIVHRDIKSSNIMVSSQGNASITDFGLAMLPDASRLTAEGSYVGTPAYMSPEQAQGDPVDQRTDLWSLGVVLFEVLTGRLPFRRDREIAAVHAVIHSPAPLLRELRPEAPVELEQIVGKALAKSPAERWQSAAEMASALSQIQASRDATTQALILGDFETRTSVAPTVPKPVWSRRRLWALAALLAIVALSGVGFWRLRRTDLPLEKQVAVLPMEVVGQDAETRVIADGLTETLTAKLTQLEQFRGKVMVVPASEIRARKIVSAEDARKIYGANLVITGSAQRVAKRLQFNFALVDAVKLRQIGVRSVDTDPRDPVELRNGAVDAVTGLLDLELSPAERRVVSAGESSSSAAYSDYLKGRGYLARYDVTGNVDLALENLARAVAQDPKFALAYASLAEGYWWKALRTSDKHWADRAVESAQRAIQLDNKLVVAHVKLAEIYSQQNRRDEALQELELAQRISPGQPDALRALASLYSSLGRFDDAERAYRESTEHRPTDWFGFTNLGLFYLQRSRYPEAERALLTAQRLTPDNEVVYRILAGTYLRQGQYAKARTQLQTSLKLDPSARNYSTLGVTLYYEGRMTEAASALEAAIDLDSATYTYWGNLGTVYRHVANAEGKAQAAFRRAIELGEKVLQVTPGDPQIHANLAEYHAKLGERGKALRELEAIPSAQRKRFLNRIVLVHDLVGQRDLAIKAFREAPADLGLTNSIKDDPDLAALWKDPGFQQALREARP